MEKAVCKALVALFGPREAARQLGVNENTMLGWCSKFGWKKAAVEPEKGPDMGDIIKRAIERSKQLSTVNLAKFVENAAGAAANLEKPLDSARKVRDVAGVYSTLWPAEKEPGLIEGEILIGKLEVRDASEENPVIEAEVLEVEPIREELPDGGQESD